jgi:hypothetical protein
MKPLSNLAKPAFDARVPDPWTDFALQFAQGSTYSFMTANHRLLQSKAAVKEVKEQDLHMRFRS